MVNHRLKQYRWSVRWWHCFISLWVLQLLNRYPSSVAFTTTDSISTKNNNCQPAPPLQTISTGNKKYKKQNHMIRLYESISPLDGEISRSKQEHPLAILVQTEIVPERLTEFLQLIEHNAIQSRKEPECIRFDVIQSQEQSNKFFFYEIYSNSHSAIEYHKSQSHYQAWADFKESGGTLSSTTYKSHGLFLTD